MQGKEILSYRQRYSMRNYQVGWYMVKILKRVKEPRGILKRHNAQMSESAGRLCNAVNRLYQYSQGIIFRNITKCKSRERYCIPTIVFNPTNMCLVIPPEHICRVSGDKGKCSFKTLTHNTGCFLTKCGNALCFKGVKNWRVDTGSGEVTCQMKNSSYYVFEIGSPCRSQARFDLQPPYLHPQRPRTTSLCYHAWLG